MAVVFGTHAGPSSPRPFITGSSYSALRASKDKMLAKPVGIALAEMPDGKKLEREVFVAK